MELSQETVEWLNSIGLEEIMREAKQLETGKTKLDEDVVFLFANGQYLVRILQKMLEKRQVKSPLLSNMKIMENSSTPVAKLYNWNIVAETLKLVGIEFDQDIKSLIVSGDISMIHELVTELQRKDATWTQSPFSPHASRMASPKAQIRSISNRNKRPEPNAKRELVLPAIKGNNNSTLLGTTTSEVNMSRFTNFHVNQLSKLISQ